MKRVVIHTDGGCAPNPGRGGWAAVLRHGSAVKEISGAVLHTTNNRMELTAACEALEALKEPCHVELYTDSEYVKKGLTEWMPRWKAKRWRRGSNKPVLNEDLWRRLDQAASRHRIDWHWVRGHAGNPDNERCDQLCSQAMARLPRD